jgi:serine/threonine protein kinase
VFGSEPYIAPEEWIEDAEYFPTKVDVWATGMIFYVILTKNLIWSVARMDDHNYTKYLQRRETGFPPFETHPHHAKKLLYALLHPDPQQRPEMAEVLKDTWIKSIDVPEPQVRKKSRTESVSVKNGVKNTTMVERRRSGTAPSSNAPSLQRLAEGPETGMSLRESHEVIQSIRESLDKLDLR